MQDLPLNNLWPSSAPSPFWAWVSTSELVFKEPMFWYSKPVRALASRRWREAKDACWDSSRAWPACMWAEGCSEPAGCGA